MDINNTQLLTLVIRYDALLQRYARRIINDQRAASFVTQLVFEEFYTASNKTEADCRIALCSLTRQLCYQWLFDNLNTFNYCSPNFQISIPIAIGTPNQSIAFNALFAKKPKNPV